MFLRIQNSYEKHENTHNRGFRAFFIANFFAGTKRKQGNRQEIDKQNQKSSLLKKYSENKKLGSAYAESENCGFCDLLCSSYQKAIVFDMSSLNSDEKETVEPQKLLDADEFLVSDQQYELDDNQAESFEENELEESDDAESEEVADEDPVVVIRNKRFLTG